MASAMSTIRFLGTGMPGGRTPNGVITMAGLLQRIACW
jgi:hypothetical protein